MIEQALYGDLLNAPPTLTNIAYADVHLVAELYWCQNLQESASDSESSNWIQLTNIYETFNCIKQC